MASPACAQVLKAEEPRSTGRRRLTLTLHIRERCLGLGPQHRWTLSRRQDTTRARRHGLRVSGVWPLLLLAREESAIGGMGRRGLHGVHGHDVHTGARTSRRLASPTLFTFLLPSPTFSLLSLLLLDIDMLHNQSILEKCNFATMAGTQTRRHRWRVGRLDANASRIIRGLCTSSQFVRRSPKL